VATRRPGEVTASARRACPPAFNWLGHAARLRSEDKDRADQRDEEDAAADEGDQRQYARDRPGADAA
jgi:hypothetical protein